MEDEPAPKALNNLMSALFHNAQVKRRRIVLVLGINHTLQSTELPILRYPCATY
jgi:hypothetical protein